MTDWEATTIFLRSDYFNIEYNHVNNYLFITNPDQALEKFEEGMMEVISALKQFDTNKVIWDVPGLYNLSEKAVKWIASYWISEAEKAGYTYAVFLLPKGSFSQMTTKEVMSTSWHNVIRARRTAYFDKVQDAKAWLKQINLSKNSSRLYKSAHGHLDYDPSVPCILAFKSSSMTSYEFIGFMEKGLDMVKEKMAIHGKLGWLTDLSQTNRTDLCDTLWIRAIEYGVRYVACIVPKNTLLKKASIEKYMELSTSSGSFIINAFEDKMSAKEWLREMLSDTKPTN